MFPSYLEATCGQAGTRLASVTHAAKTTVTVRISLNVEQLLKMRLLEVTNTFAADIIANFTEVDTYRDMPRAELCHTCYARRLAMMQSSQYSVYNEYYKEELEYVYETCGGKGPTDIPPPLMAEPPIPAPYCLTGSRYITVEGDTCESISNATSVSSASLYMANQELLKDCSQISAGIVACIPVTCQTYYVRPSDTCISIETALEFEFGSLQTYNSWINHDCSNLQPATDFYGKMICVSPQGGSFTGSVPPPAATNPPAHDGYSPEVVSPPDDAPVAEGTTLNCGKWHVVESDDTCATICIQGSITIHLFQQVNPSLDAGTACSNKLKVGTAVCVGPIWDWDIREEDEPITIGVERLAFTDLPSVVSEKVKETSTH